MIVDALDEYSARNITQIDLFDQLLELQRCLPIRLLFTSRSIPHIIAGVDAKSRIDVRASDEDIRAYAALRCSRLAKGVQSRLDLVERILDGVARAAAGMWVLPHTHPFPLYKTDLDLIIASC